MERQVEARARVPFPPHVVRDILLTEPASALASRPVPPRDRRFPVELRVDFDGGSAAVQQAVIDIGPPDVGGPAASVFPLSWVPASHTRLLPGFQGTLELMPEDDDTCLRIRGSYRPPLGPPGAFGDGLIGHRLARRSIHALTVLLADRLADEARRRADSVGIRAAPYPESLVDSSPAETWLG